MCSCSDDPKDDPNNDWIVNFDSVTAFTKDAYWEFCYDKEIGRASCRERV